MNSLKSSVPLQTLGSQHSLSIGSFLGSIADLKASTGPFGPFSGDLVREVVEAVEGLDQQVNLMKGVVNVLRQATFADEQAVRAVLRFSFSFPEVLILCGRLIKSLGQLEFAEVDHGKV